MNPLTKRPIFFRRNRVFRVYDGGLLFADFFGDPPEDGKYPEEWIASSVRARNRNSQNEREGLSVVEGTDTTFRDLLAAEPSDLLGGRTGFDVLVKMLDSGIRLPVQAHPDPAFSKAHLHSGFGKTEAWLVVATRPDACVYFGFKEPMTKQRFSQYVERSRTDKQVMENLLNRIPVQSGDVFVITARSVHAIGKGCLILEVQEPTDFTIQPEYWCGDYLLNDDEMYLGLDKDTALDVFDYSVSGEAAYLPAKKTPVLLRDEQGVRTERLVGPADTPCFSLLRHTLYGGARLCLANAPALYLALAGEGRLTSDSEGYERSLKKGDYFFLPHAAKDRFFAESAGSLTLAVCLPPAR